MNTGAIWFNRPSSEAVERFLSEQREHPVTFGHVGATGGDGRGALAGFRVDRWAVDLGVGDGVFDRGRLGLRSWAAHRGAGIEVTPPKALILTGETVALVVPVFRCHVMAACRVVWVVDDDHELGFAYATLPGHPEDGEEAFVIRRDSTDRVVFEIRAVSRPAHPLARAGGPVARQLQLRTTRAYLTAMQTWVSG